MLRKEIIDAWRNDGFCLVDNLFKPDEVRKLSAGLETILFTEHTDIKGQVRSWICPYMRTSWHVRVRVRVRVRVIGHDLSILVDALGRVW